MPISGNFGSLTFLEDNPFLSEQIRVSSTVQAGSHLAVKCLHLSYLSLHFLNNAGVV